MTKDKNGAKTPLQSILAGGTAGGVESLITYPTEYIKTRKQLHKSADSPLRILINTLRTSGPSVLYTGAGAFVASNSSKSAVRFFTFDGVRKWLPKDPSTGKHPSWGNMVAGVAAGVTESLTVVTPGENLKTKIIEDRGSAKRFNSTSHALSTIAREEGWRGFFRGAIPVTTKQASNAVVRFTTYNLLLDTMKPALEKSGKGAVAPVVSGAAAGVVTVYATMPFDVIKTRMQLAQRVGTSSQSTWGCFRGIVGESGIQGLWHGTTPRLVRLSISSALSFSIYESVIQFLQAWERRESKLGATLG